jgi:hypothetical protein
MSWLRIALGLVASAPLLAIAEEAVVPETLELIPEDPPAFTVNNIFAPITGLFLGGPGYWYDPRIVEIETTPPGAIVDLFYVRRGFQKSYEQADAPVRVVLPSRVEATSRDILSVRALLDGYQQKEVKIAVRSRETRVMIDLAPLPNTLVGFSHTYFGGRGSLEFTTKEALTFRLQKNDRGIGVVLTQTGSDPRAIEAMQGSHSLLVEDVRPQQLGEDLVVRVALSELGRGDTFETRSRQSTDPVRGLHRFALDFVPADGGASNVELARRALANITPADVSPCALAFDRTLREQLDPADLARALNPRGAYTDKYMRAAMKRLGEVSPDGRIRTLDGGRFDVSIPIELMAAATQPEQAIGYLVLLRRFVELLEPGNAPDVTLKGLVAPQMSPSSFAAAMTAARASEQSCP